MNKTPLTTDEVADLCRSLSQLLRAGITPGDALTWMAQAETGQERLLAMARRCDEGQPLSAVFREAGCFPGYVCALLEIGHRTGQTAEVLEALADYYHRRSRMNRQLKTALTYPAMLLTVLLGVVGILFIWVLPVFDDVYAQLGSGMQGFAGGLLAFGGLLRAALPWICGFIAAVLCAAAIAPLRKKLLDFLAARWGDRGVLARVNSARLVQALALAVSSGLTDGEAARLACQLSAGEASAFARRCEALLRTLESGTTLPKALLQNAMISPGDCRLLEIGIRSGQQETVLSSLSQRLLEEAETSLEQAAGKVEPAIIIIACALIGGVLLSVMLPLVQIMNAIG